MGRLFYRGGYLIEDLAPVVTYEEVAYLLWHGELPNQAQLDEQCKVMAAARHLNKAAQGALLAMDPATEPMDVLRTVVSAQGAAKALTKPTLDEAMALTAIFPTIVAATYRRRQGKEIVEARPELSHAAPVPEGTVRRTVVVTGTAGKRAETEGDGVRSQRTEAKVFDRRPKNRDRWRAHRRGQMLRRRVVRDEQFCTSDQFG